MEDAPLFIKELSEEIQNQLTKSEENLKQKLDALRHEIESKEAPPPPPAPQVHINTAEISEKVKAHLDNLKIKVDYSEVLQTIKWEFGYQKQQHKENSETVKRINDNAIEAIRAIRDEKQSPARIKLEGDFYGFTGRKPFFYYFFIMVFLIILMSMSTWMWMKTHMELQDVRHRINIHKTNYERLKKENPKIAKEYFDYN
jgi:hypothetical protein